MAVVICDPVGVGAHGGEAVELRVHGVSGASAETILDHPIVVRVAGDRNAGFYRVRPGNGAAGGATAGVAVEAYRWGALTAGAAVRTASMLLLLPFMLGNVAIWLRPTTADRFGLLGGLCRLLAGSLTVAFTLAIVGSAMNLVGWQCVPYVECRVGRPYLSWLAALPMGPRLAVLALIPLLALRLFWVIGARSARAFEGFGATPSEPGTSEGTESLSAPGFWDDERVTSWLRQIHVGLGAGTVDVSLLVGVSDSGRNLVGSLVRYAAASLVMFCVVLLCLPVPAAGVPARRFLRLLWGVVAGVTVLSLGYAAFTREVPVVVGQMPGYEGGVAGLVGAQGVLLVLVAALTVVRRRAGPDGTRPFLWGLGTPLVAALSVSVASAFTATLVFRVADHLDRGRIPDPIRPNPPALGPLEPPVAYWWAALAGLTALLVVAAAATITLLISRRRRRAYAHRVAEQDYPRVPASASSRLRVVRETIARSHVTEELGPTLVAFFVISSIGLAAVALDLVGIGPAQLVAEISGRRDGSAVLVAYVSDVGIWVISLLVIGLLILGFRAYRSAEARRLVAVLWDLGTFWPRTVHPFAPPCYAARAVPELTKRVSALAAQGPVVISGHSHGSVLAAAAVLQLPPAALSRVALLTHGCPLRRIYARLYPAYLGQQTMCDLGERLDWRWRNLWRDTDPIGGAVFDRRHGASPVCDNPAAEAVDVRLRDPRAVTIDPADTVPPPVERHWPYHTQLQYQTAVRELTDGINHPNT
ncbi:hypothetical protein B0E53_00413 [Micromonospora sp. MH33]|uniref:hypothetical protein n=1 Tax=Micromonospora sp. MH33 TaxID=1945509 RepID=UPI000D264523|nr:hypothetical protein [Micromonospora sp. MH33]PSK67603.1 hypothetical protein B0E53_00413 [Micromonospora sp. MH33]